MFSSTGTSTRMAGPDSDTIAGEGVSLGPVHTVIS